MKGKCSIYQGWENKQFFDFDFDFDLYNYFDFNFFLFRFFKIFSISIFFNFDFSKFFDFDFFDYRFFFNFKFQGRQDYFCSNANFCNYDYNN